MSLLVICQNSRLFPNTLSANGKYCLLNRYNLTQPIQMHLSQKQKPYSEFFSTFLKCSLNFEHFQKNDDPHSWFMSEIKSCFRVFIIKQHGKRAKALLKFERQHLFYIYWSLCRQLTCRISLLVICKISTLLPNTLTADGNYSLLNRDNLMQPIQMYLSQKQKPLS